MRAVDRSKNIVAGAPSRVPYRIGDGAADTRSRCCKQILEHVGERTTAPARVPSQAVNGQPLTAPEEVFEAIPELEFEQTANLMAEAGHDQWTHLAGADAEPIPELEFDHTLGL